MGIKNKKGQIDVDMYGKIVRENKVMWELLEKMKEYFTFPVGSLLEIGTGSANFLTLFLIEKERAKEIGKFYAMEPVDEFFEESKRSVVRLSRTDATLHEYYGGNPFNVVAFAMVYGHIIPDNKQKFINNIYNNLEDEESKLILIDAFLPEFDEEDPEARKEANAKFLQAHKDYAEKTGNSYMLKYFSRVIDDGEEDVWAGKYKSNIKDIEDKMKRAGFDEVSFELFKGEGDHDWESMGLYLVVGEKE